MQFQILLSFRYPKTSFVLQFFPIYVSFWVVFLWATLSYFLKKLGLWVSKNRISVKTYANVSIKNFLILTLFSTVHSFLYVHTGFRTSRIAIKPNWNNYYNIPNVPTTLYLSQMKQISSTHYFLDLFTNPTALAISYFGSHIYLNAS